MDKYGWRDVFTFVALTLIFIGLVTIVSSSTYLIALVCILIGTSYAIITGSFWSSIPIVTQPNVVGVAMGFALFAQAFGSGLMLLITGFILDDENLSVANRWVVFFLLMIVFSGTSWILSILSIYFDRKDGGGRLHAKHVLPAMSAEMNPEVEETKPLVKRDWSVSTSTSASSRVHRYYGR